MSWNFGLKSNETVRFGSVRLEYLGPLEVVLFDRSGPARPKRAVPFAKMFVSSPISLWYNRNFGGKVSGTLRFGWKLTFDEKCCSIFPWLVPLVSDLMSGIMQSALRELIYPLSLVFTSDASASIRALSSTWKRDWRKYNPKYKHKDQTFSFSLCLRLCLRSLASFENETQHKHKEICQLRLANCRC